MKSVDSCKTTRVTISIPQEAGENLKQLARFNAQLLNELGILSMQIDDAKPVVVDAMQNIQHPDTQRKSFAGCSWKSDDLILGCWRPTVANIRSQVTPVLNQIQKHSRDLLMVPYGEFLSPAYSANLYMPNCHSSAVTPELKAASSFVVENERRQRCTANRPKLCRSKPQLLPFATSQMSSYFGAGYHHHPELCTSETVTSVHNELLSYSLPVSCNHPSNAVFEPPCAKVRPRRQRKKAFNNVEKSLQSEESDQTCFVRAAELVKVCLSTDPLASNSNNVLTVARQFHVDSLTKPALPGMVTKALESAIVPNDGFSQAVVSECKFNCAVGSSKLAADFEISRLDLNSPDKTRLKFSCTAPTRDAAFLLDTGRSCDIHFARDDEEGMAILSSSVSDRCLSSPNSLRSTACVLRDDAKFSCAIPEMRHDGSMNSRAKPYGNASCGTPPYIAPLSSVDFHLNDKSGFLETVSPDVELLSSGNAVSESCAISMALLSCDESVANSLQTSCVQQTYTPADATFLGIERDSRQCLAATCSIRKYDLTEEKSGSGVLPLNLQVSAEMKKLSGPMPVRDPTSATDVQLTDLNSFHKVDELNYDLNAGRSGESAANKRDVGSIENVAEMSLDKEVLSCVTSSRQLDAHLDSNDAKILALQFSSDDCSIMEELNNLPLEKTEPLLEELRNLQCVLAADASELVSETQQLPETSVNMILTSDEGSVAAANDDDDLKLPFNSLSIDTFTESSCADDFATRPLVTATLTPLLTSERSQDTMQRISSNENEPISAFNKSQESVDIALDSNLTDRNLFEKLSLNGCQVSCLRGKRSNGTAPLCVDWSALSDDDIKVIKLKNRHSALDLHSRHFEELSICSRKALSDDLRQLNALVMCEFDSLAVKASSLLCVTKLTDGTQSGLQSRKVRIIESTDMSGNLRMKRKRTGHFSMLEKHRLKRRTGKDTPRLTKGQRSQLFE